jgi:hypothetical protein
MAIVKAPYRQGHLDAMCGIYSLVNATRLVMRFNEEESYTLFWRILAQIERRKRLSLAISDGLYPADVNWLLKKLVSRRYGLAWYRPFYRKTPSIDDFWDKIKDFLNEPQKAVLLSMAYEDWVHWSCVRACTERTM